MDEKTHAQNCASHDFKYSGDVRNQSFGQVKKDCDRVGYHTFNELYEHRITLWIALCKSFHYGGEEDDLIYLWRTTTHSDGTSWDGWFVLGFGKEKGEQITYHLPMSRWNECNFATTIEKAPEFDGHTSQDVLERIKKLF